MAESDQPKKETVRIQLPISPSPTLPQQIVESHETVRIHVPLGETGNQPVPSSPPSASGEMLSSNFFPPPKLAAASSPLSGSPHSVPNTAPSEAEKGQPRMKMPNIARENPTIAVAPMEKRSMLLYWMLVALSAVILIIQIWTYFS